MAIKSNIKREVFNITVDGSGDFEESKNTDIFGFLYAIVWVDGDLVDGVDFTLSVVGINGEPDRTVMAVLAANDDKTYYPRTLEHLDTDGTDLASHSYPIIDGKLKMVVADGGASKSGKAIIYTLQEELG